ncbi:hypothetical protein, partial [Pseudomonas sp. 2995-3]|uniref:hypothetical protein n=1 Tax=Pseudomonas sp. 2995-3 TaxID=1712680 RepID=UPI001C47F4DA
RTRSWSSGPISEDQLNWSFSNLERRNFSDYTDIIDGVILNPEITEVRITSTNDNVYSAEIIEYEGGRFWFLVTDGDDVSGATVTALDEEGEIVEEHHSRD